jgi:hypothetical protein
VSIPVVKEERQYEASPVKSPGFTTCGRITTFNTGGTEIKTMYYWGNIFEDPCLKVLTGGASYQWGVGGDSPLSTS